MNLTAASQPYTTLLLFIVVGLFSQTKGNCSVKINSPHAAAVRTPGPRYPAYSCTSCGNPTSHEVHILNIYQPTGNNRRGRQNPHNVMTVKVNILKDSPAKSTVKLKLLLVNHEAVNWLINKPDSVTISQVILMSYYNDTSSVRLEDEGHIDVEKRIRPAPYSDNTAIIDYARTNFGTVTSYSAVTEASEWWLTVGKCSTSLVDVPSPTSTVPPLHLTTPDLSDCENQWKKPCWVRYDFVYESSVNECNGIQYVTEYHLDRIYYIGATLCTTTRYSLFMSTSLEDTFFGIIDTIGEGQDHCQVVGLPFALKERAITNPVRVRSFGYCRTHWGYSFKKRTVESGIRPKWYECGITIPMSEMVPTTTETPSSPSKLQSFNTVAFVSIIGGLLIALIITMALFGGCRRKQTPEPDYGFGIPLRAVPPLPAQSTHTEPSAPPPEPPTQDTNLPPPPPQVGMVDEGAPPSYEDIMNYPLAKATVAPPPYNCV